MLSLDRKTLQIAYEIIHSAVIALTLNLRLFIVFQYILNFLRIMNSQNFAILIHIIDIVFGTITKTSAALQKIQSTNIIKL